MTRVAVPIHPLTRLSNTEISDTTEFVTADSTNDHALENTSGNVALLIKNGSGVSFTATIITPYSQDGLALPDLSVVIGAGDDAIVGPFPKGVYNQADDTISIDAGATSADVKLVGIQF